MNFERREVGYAQGKGNGRSHSEERKYQRKPWAFFTGWAKAKKCKCSANILKKGGVDCPIFFGGGGTSGGERKVEIQKKKRRRKEKDKL